MSTLRDLKTAQPPESTVDEARLVTVGVTIVGHPDTNRIGDLLPLVDLHSNRKASLSRLTPEFSKLDGSSSVALGTSYVSRQPLEFRAPSTGGLEMCGAFSTTHTLANGVPLDGRLCFSNHDLQCGIVLELAKSVVLVLHTFAPPMPQSPDFGLVGGSSAIRQLQSDIQALGDAEVPVLLRGETGVGKELVARAIHESSVRHRLPYVCVNMAAITTATAASTLFGHKRGAFTDASHDHAGYFWQANGGTLFMDELGDTPPSIQPLLLRATEGEIQVLGEAKTRQVDVRLIAATDLDLEAAVDRGDFRSQLQQRLAGYELTIPPLRARRDDIGRLFIHFLRQELRSLGREVLLRTPATNQRPWLRASFMGKLARYSWPGNVRQLRNVARQLAISNRDSAQFRVDARLRQLFASLEAAPAAARDEVPRLKPRAGDLSDADIAQALRDNDYNVTITASALEVSRSWLFTRMDSCVGVRKARELTREEITATLDRCHGKVKDAALRLEVSFHGLKQRMTTLGLN